jgi:hypothetical protein
MHDQTNIKKSLCLLLHFLPNATHVPYGPYELMDPHEAQLRCPDEMDVHT